MSYTQPTTSANVGGLMPSTKTKVTPKPKPKPHAMTPKAKSK